MTPASVEQPRLRTALATARGRGLIVVLATFVVSRVVIWSTGGHFRVGYLRWGIQLLDWTQLGAHPFESVYHLHTQPPLFNLFVGIVLRWSPFAAGLSFQVLYVLFALVMVLGCYRLGFDLGGGAGVATVAAVLVVLNPVLLSFENSVTYEMPTMMLLVLGALAFVRWARTGTVWSFAALTAATTATVMTRALMHPVWLVVVLGLAFLLRRPVTWRPVLLAVGVACLLVGGWMVKNAILFDTPTMSSWFGMNLHRAVIAPLDRGDFERLVRDGEVSRVSRAGTFGDYRVYEPYIGPCRSHTGEPTLDRLRKIDPVPNFNAECYLPLYAQFQDDALAALVARPGRYLETRGVGLARFAEPQRAPQAPRSAVVSWLDRVYDRASLPVDLSIGMRGWAFPLLKAKALDVAPSITVVIALLLVLARGLLAVARALARRARDGDAGWVFVGWTVVFVLACSTLLELGENDRFRVLVDPLVIVGAVVIAGNGLIRAWHASRTRA
jgi:hypothetical protein